MHGLLILHGFTGSLDTVRAVEPLAHQFQIPYAMPVLRGHGTTYQDLRGVKAQDWLDDAEDAFLGLAQQTEQIIIIGLSMGGVLALQLAKKYPDRIRGVICLAPALLFKDPLVSFTPLIKRIFKYWKSPSSFSDKQLEKEVCTNYPYFATDAFHELYRLGKATISDLGEIKSEMSILYARQDSVVSAQIVPILQNGLKNPKNQFICFEQSGHEMLQDCEKDSVVKSIEKQLSIWLKV